MSRARLRLVPLLLVGAMLAPACTKATEQTQPTLTSSPSTLGPAEVRLEQVAVLDQPLALAVRSGDSALYVAEKVGRVVALREGADPAVVLDISAQVSLGGEQGLLGLAISPDGRFLYVDYTDTGGNTHVAEFGMSDGEIDPSTQRDVLFVEQPFSNHNGGGLAFGPDGYLYVALGDGGSAGDPNGNAQSLSTLLGKILRISPRPSDGQPYGIPPDNPFVGVAGARPEIWAYGLRNPFRFSFDRQTGDLWIGDVGQNAWEEVDLEPADSKGGLNFGWNLFEGSHPFETGADPPETVPPVYEYSHSDGGCVVTGGYVYRGKDIPALAGGYVFADFCLGRLEALRISAGGKPQVMELGPIVENIASFGEDAAGELYALSLSGPVYRLAPAGS